MLPKDPPSSTGRAATAVASAPAPAVGEHPAPPQPPRRAFALLLVAALLHGLCYLLVLPPWMGEDEPWHVEYAHHIGQGHLPWGGVMMSGASETKGDDRALMSLSQLQVRQRIGGVDEADIAATQLAILDSMREHGFWARVGFAGWPAGAESFDQVAPHFSATHQPFLYYLVAGSVLRVLGLGGVEAEMWALRALSLLAYLAVVAAAYGLGRLVSRDGWIALGCAVIAAWLPVHARQAGVVNNDVLAKVFASLAILLGACVALGVGGLRAVAGALVFAALGLFTKASAAGALAVVGPALCLAAGPGGGRGQRIGARSRGALLSLGALGALAAGAALYWFTSYNPVLPRTLDNIRFRLAAAVSPELREDLLHTFAGAFAWEMRGLPGAVHVAVLIALGAALLGALWVLARGASETSRRLVLLCLAAVLVQLLLVALRGEGKGRYLLPVLPALCAVVSVGLLGPLPARLRPAAFGALALALVAYDSVYLLRGLVFSEYAWWGF